MESVMNEELIHELAIKAGFKKYDGELYSPYIEGYELNGELEEFAEHIIKECMNRISKWNTFIIENDIVHHSNIADDINKDLREHFGVES
jgi:hypothetical protein